MGNHQQLTDNRRSEFTRTLLVFVGLTLFAGILRFQASLDEFWLDEIFTYNLALGLNSTLEAFTIPIDHHILNTLFMYWMGDHSSWWLYRLPSVLSGTLSVTILGYIALRGGLLPAAITMLIAAVSYPLIVYSSEARGYAPAIFFSLLCFLLVEHNNRYRSHTAIVLFWLAAILAVLSQLLAVYVLVALGCWSVLKELREQPSLRKAIVELTRCYAIPVLFCFWLYTFVISKNTNVGASETYQFGVLKSTLALALGAPEMGLLSLFGALLSCILFVYGILLLRRRDASIWLFYLVVILVAPAAIIMLDTRGHLFVRYFILCFPFFYLLLTEVLMSMRSSGLGSIVAGFILILVLSGNALLTYQFLDKGRGHYREMLAFMVKETHAGKIVVSSDHDFRNETALKFYAQYLDAPESIAYTPANLIDSQEVEWFIIHTTAIGFQPPNKLQINARVFELQQNNEYGGLSGFHTALYRDAVAK